MDRTYVAILVILMAMCIGPGCGRSQKPPNPPIPPRDAEIVYETSNGRGLLAKYVLAPAERDAMMDILLSNPTETLRDSPATLDFPWGMLHVAGRYYYNVRYGEESGHISVVFRTGSKETIYLWRSDRTTTLAKHLYEATSNRDIEDAFADFAAQQVPTTRPDTGQGSNR